MNTAWYCVGYSTGTPFSVALNVLAWPSSTHELTGDVQGLGLTWSRVPVQTTAPVDASLA